MTATFTTDLPSAGPFTAAMAREAGLSRNCLQKLVASGQVRSDLYGVYVDASCVDSLDLRVREAALVLPPHAVVADRSAAWLHGVDVLDTGDHGVVPRLDAVSIGGKGRSIRNGVFGGKRTLIDSETMEFESGLLVTTPVRTACDIGRLFGRYRALATLDQFRRSHGLSVEDLAAVLPRLRGHRGVIQLRELIPLSTADAHSPPESWTRLFIHDDGLPVPAAQVPTWVPDWGDALLENAYEHLRIAVEYDGEEHHTSDEDRERDERRRAALTAAGWIIFVLRRGDFARARRAVWLAELRAAIAERTPEQPSKRRYARGPDQASYRWRRRW